MTAWWALAFFSLVQTAAPRAAVVALDPARPLSPQERSAVESALHVTGHRALDPADAAVLEDGAATRPAVAPPDALFVEARRALLNFDEAAAQGKLEQARDILCESPRILAERTLLADIHLLSGQIAVAAGRAVEAQREFALAAVLEPTRTLHPGLYPPEVVAAYQQAQQELKALAPGALVVEAVPAEAQLYLDGEFSGSSPLLVPELAAGLHYVTAVVQGRLARTRVVEVISGHSTQLSLLVPVVPAGTSIPELLAAYRRSPSQPASATPLMVAVGADLLLAAGADRGAIARRSADGSVVALELHDDAFAQADPGQRTRRLVEESEELLRQRARSIAAASAPASQARSLPEPVPEPGSAWPSWVWVAAGAAGSALVAATAVAIGLYIASQPPPTPPEDRVNIVIGGPGL
ncbi:MAG: PEGA domain-containing protein [Deltaproteobacteria bacterium]|nr:PEGA domain-containing protein [Deltaproteobacteria bacterium]